jgi:hypothetical protein
LHILPLEEREATTQSRFPDNRDRAERAGSLYPGINLVRVRGGISLREARARSLTILYGVRGRVPANLVPLSMAGKE